ncbi:MAG TPA: outer membrane beta-barrel protein, partial [Pelobium sp.]|nr:outer membrane beta-barrel protein [Pelobium sp.]
EKINSTVGLFAQPSVLSGTDFSRGISTYQKNFNWVPSLRFAYAFSREKRLTLNYRGSNNLPDFRQLQPVTDNSNLQNTVTGNPNLKPEFAHQTNLEYRQTNVRSGTAWYGRLRYNQVQDKIVTSKNIVADSIKQEISYVNTDGFYNASGDYSFSLPFSERKFVLAYFGRPSYSKNIALTNNERIIGENIGLTQGLKLRIDIADVLDSEIKTSYSYSTATFSAASIEDRSSNQLNIGLDGRNYFFKDLTLGYNFSKTFNNGYNASIGNPTFLSLYMEHRFLKGNKGSVRLQGFDLFGQNTGIQRDIFDNEIVDRQSNRLSTYFLLSFNYRFQNFGG